MAVLSSIAQPDVAGAAEPAGLDPSSPWNVHYAEDYCRLIRVFGSGREAVTLIIDQYEPGDEFRISLMGERMKGAAGSDEARIRFGEALPQQYVLFYTGSIGTNPAWIFVENIRIRPLSDTEKTVLSARGSVPVAPIADHEKASVNFIDIGRPLRHSLRLRTGPMKASFAAMNECTDELLTHWGIDAERHKMRLRSAIPARSPSTWLRAGDYPSAMLQKGMPGLVEFRLDVGADGFPTACHIQQSTHPEGFDRTVCDRLMKRARFEPALDRDGKPMASYYRDSVRFAFPN
ncbi:energy transducer TonB [Sphingopyxis flava]|nr:energy transducer TonB [Sphingopyxis flava]